MNAILKSGKEVRGVNSGRGLEGAAYDFNAGEPYTAEQLERPLFEREINHLHVYLSHSPKGPSYFQFICSDQALTLEELGEATEAVERAREEADAEADELRETLLSPAGDQLIAERQGKNSDKQTASRDLARVLFPEIVQARQNVSWAMVKDEIRRLRIVGIDSGCA